MQNDFSPLMQNFLSAIKPAREDLPLTGMMQAFKQSQQPEPLPQGFFYAGPMHGIDFIIEGRIREWAQRIEREKRLERERQAKKNPPPRP